MCAASSAQTYNASGKSLPSTIRLADVFTLIGCALGGEAGRRLVEGMGLSTSPDTLLRLIRKYPENQVPTPRELGVDDFSFCKRKSYGTILLELEKRVPIDLLPDREATTLEKWLKTHTGVEIISRDRGGPYAEGARKGVPDAQQVVDRGHLLANRADSMKSFFSNRQAQLKALVDGPSEGVCEEEAKRAAPWIRGRTPQEEEISRKLHQERLERYQQIHDLHAKKLDVAPIAHQLRLSRQAVYTSLHMTEAPERSHFHRTHESNLAPDKRYVIQRWNEGCRNAQQVARELKEQGYTGSAQPIVRFFAHFRKQKDARKFKSVDPTTVTPVKEPPKRPPTASQVAHWITFKEEQHLDWQQKYLTQLCEADPQTQEAYELIEDFPSMLRERQGERLDVWLQKVEERGIAELKSFAQGLKKD